MRQAKCSTVSYEGKQLKLSGQQVSNAALQRFASLPMKQVVVAKRRT